MNILLRFTAISSISFIINMLMLVLRAKVLAVLLEPQGIGLLSQLNTLDGMLSTFASIGIGYGITNLIARGAGGTSTDTQADTYWTGFYLSLLLGCGTLLVLVLFARLFSTWLLGTPEFAVLFYIIAAAYPLKFLTGLFSSTLNGLKDITALAWIKVIAAVLGVFFMVALAWMYRFPGAVVGILAWAVVAWLVNRFFLYRNPAASTVIKNRRRFDPQVAREIIRFGAANLAVMLLGNLAVLAARSQLIHAAGSAANGIYQVVWAISSQYLMLIPQSLWIYSFPHISGLLDSPDLVRVEMRKIIRLGMLLFGPAAFLLLANRSLVVPILYTQQFMAAADLFRIQVWGDFSYLFLWWISIPLFAGRKFTRLLTLEGIRSGGFLLVSLLLMEDFGATGMCIAYAVMNSAALVAGFFMVWRQDDFIFGRKETTLALGVLFLMAIGTAAAGDHLWTAVLSAVGVIVWWYLVLDKDELSAVRVFVHDHLRF